MLLKLKHGIDYTIPRILRTLFKNVFSQRYQFELSLICYESVIFKFIYFFLSLIIGKGELFLSKLVKSINQS